MSTGSFSLEYLAIVVIELVCIIFSIMLHEVSHGYMAYRLGDTTAKDAGRLTLNPAKHLDPVGSIAIPLVLMLCNLPVFAYAKPVPYNPYRLKVKKRKWGELAVAFAGPASNLLQALAGALVCFVVQQAATGVDYPSFGFEVLSWTYTFFYYYCYINLVLLFFNIIPLPPLDGASIVALFLSNKGLEVFYKVKQYSMFILLALLVLVPMVTPWDPLSWYMSHTAGALLQLLVP